MLRPLRLSLFVWICTLLTTVLWSSAALAYPGGVNTGDTGLAAVGGCNGCHSSGVGTAPANPLVSVNSGGAVSLVGTPNLTVPVNSSNNTFDVTFTNSNITGLFTRRGGFLVFHTDNDGIPDHFGALGAGTGSHTCAAGALCPDAASLSGSTEVTHDIPYTADGLGNVTVHFTYTPPPGAAVCGKYGFRIWLNAVNGDAGCTDPDRAMSFDFTISTTCPADVNQCHQSGVCSVSAVGSTGTCGPNKGDGTSCNLDANLCTPDTCQSGTCTGAASIVCPSDQCHNAGICNPGTGVCAPMTNKGNGTSCNADASACTVDTCQAGVCTFSTNLSCTTDQCHTIGACVPASGCPCPSPKATAPHVISTETFARRTRVSRGPARRGRRSAAAPTSATRSARAFPEQGCVRWPSPKETGLPAIKTRTLVRKTPVKLALAVPDRPSCVPATNATPRAPATRVRACAPPWCPKATAPLAIKTPTSARRTPASPESAPGADPHVHDRSVSHHRIVRRRDRLSHCGSKRQRNVL